MAGIIKKILKNHQKSTAVKQPKAESGLSNQILYNFQVEISCHREQLKAAVKNVVAYKKTFIWEVL